MGLPPPPCAVFLFRRDLRAVDNTAYDVLRLSARREGLRVVPAFVVDPAQADPKLNPFHSARAARFMAESLASLERALGERLLVVAGPRRGSPGDRQAAALDALAALPGVPRIAALGFNADHTPYARARDAGASAWCARHDVEAVTATGDYSLVDPTQMEKPYQVFSPFFKRYAPEPTSGIKTPGHRPVATAAATSTAAEERARADVFAGMLGVPGDFDSTKSVRGGRNAGLAILARVRAGAFSAARYGVGREDLGLQAGVGTTGLSAYLKFGCVSVREAYAAAAAGDGAKAGTAEGSKNSLCREMMFRAFYDQVVYHFPATLRGQLDAGRTPNASLRPAYDAVRWRTGPAADAEAWSRGRTGVPVVDAGMRQLAATGFMHNRARMVVASFLVKDLRVDWRVGERTRARRVLTDGTRSPAFRRGSSWRTCGPTCAARTRPRTSPTSRGPGERFGPSTTSGPTCP